MIIYFDWRIASRKMTKEEWRKHYREARIMRRVDAAVKTAAEACAQAIGHISETMRNLAKEINELYEKVSLLFEQLAEHAETVGKDGCDNWYNALHNTAKRSQTEFYVGYEQGRRDWLYGDPFCKKRQRAYFLQT